MLLTQPSGGGAWDSSQPATPRFPDVRSQRAVQGSGWAAGAELGARKAKGPMALLRALFGDRFGAASRERTSAEMTTQLVVTRGQALRDAHRRLHQHMRAHPALRTVTPQLYQLERGLRKQGSRALLRLPVTVLQQALAQLSMLDHDGISSDEADHLRVLRQRIGEALHVRRPRAPHRAGHEDSRMPFNLANGVDVRDISVDEFNTALDQGSDEGFGDSRSGTDSRYAESRYPESRYGQSGFGDSRHPDSRYGASLLRNPFTHSRHRQPGANGAEAARLARPRRRD